MGKFGGCWIAIRHFCQFNQALFGRWLWRYTDEEDLWRVIDCKLVEDQRGWTSKEVREHMEWACGKVFGEDGRKL